MVILIVKLKSRGTNGNYLRLVHKKVIDVLLKKVDDRQSVDNWTVTLLPENRLVQLLLLLSNLVFGQNSLVENQLTPLDLALVIEGQSL